MRILGITFVLCLIGGCSGPQAAKQPQHAGDRGPTAAMTAATLQTHYFKGVPITPAGAVQVLENEAYTVGFSSVTRTPLWAAYRLFELDPSVEQDRPNADFKADPRVNLQDLVHGSYTNSGYDRGHMVPSSPIGRCYGEGPQLETFIVTNICPQHPGCNQRAWERFEKHESYEYATRFGVIWVVDGPIFDSAKPCEELLADVRIPNAFYKIVVAEIDGKPEALAIVMRNERTEESPISDYVTTVDDIEARTHIDFFHELADNIEQAMEADATPNARWETSFVLKPTFPGTDRPIKKQLCD
jgi:endonuclease G